MSRVTEATQKWLKKHGTKESSASKQNSTMSTSRLNEATQEWANKYTQPQPVDKANAFIQATIPSASSVGMRNYTNTMNAVNQANVRNTNNFIEQSYPIAQQNLTAQKINDLRNSDAYKAQRFIEQGYDLTQQNVADMKRYALLNSDEAKAERFIEASYPYIQQSLAQQKVNELRNSDEAKAQRFIEQSYPFVEQSMAAQKLNALQNSDEAKAQRFIDQSYPLLEQNAAANKLAAIQNSDDYRANRFINQTYPSAQQNVAAQRFAELQAQKMAEIQAQKYAEEMGINETATPWQAFSVKGLTPEQYAYNIDAIKHNTMLRQNGYAAPEVVQPNGDITQESKQSSKVGTKVTPEQLAKYKEQASKLPKSTISSTNAEEMAIANINAQAEKPEKKSVWEATVEHLKRGSTSPTMSLGDAMNPYLTDTGNPYRENPFEKYNMDAYSKEDRATFAKVASQSVKNPLAIAEKSNDNTLETQQYTYMSGTEKQRYNELYGAYGKDVAEAFHNMLLNDINERIGNKLYKDEYKDKSFPEKVGSSLALGVESGVRGLANTGEALIGTGRSKATPVKDIVASNIASDADNTKVEKVAYDIAQSTGNMLPSMVVGRIAGGPAGNVLFALSQYGNSYREAIDNGETNGTASLYAIQQGLDESATNAILGGIESFGGGAVNKLLKNKLGQALPMALNSITNSDNGKRIITALLNGMADMGSEAAQEYMQYFTQNWTKALLGMKDENGNAVVANFNPTEPEALYSALLGALNAGVLNAGRSALNKTANAIPQAKANMQQGLNAVEYANNPNTTTMDKVGLETSDTISEKMAGIIDKKLDEKGVDKGTILNRYGVNSISEMNKDQAAHLVKDQGIMSDVTADVISELTYKEREVADGESSDRRRERTDNLDGTERVTEIPEQQAESNTRRKTELADVRNQAANNEWEDVSGDRWDKVEGTSELTAKIVPDEYINSDNELASELRTLKAKAESEGKKVTFIVGSLGMRDEVGDYTSRGLSLPNGEMIIRVDSDNATATQIYDHEDYHQAKIANPQIVEDTRSRFISSHSEQELDDIIRNYAKTYGFLALDEDGNYDENAFKTIAKTITEEVFADAYSGMPQLPQTENIEVAKGAATEEVKLAKERAKALQKAEKSSAPNPKYNMSDKIDSRSVGILENVLSKTGMDIPTLLEKNGVQSINDLTNGQYAKIMRELNSAKPLPKAEKVDTKSLKQKQFDIINRTNPKNKELNPGAAWIEKVDDIFDFNEAVKDSGMIDWTDDYTKEDMQKALDSGKITVYSSKPITDGMFVTPSKMEAQNYAGDGKVYSKKVSVEDVAWLDSFEGQYAPVDSETISSIDDVRTQLNNGVSAEQITEELIPDELYTKAELKDVGIDKSRELDDKLMSDAEKQNAKPKDDSYGHADEKALKDVKTLRERIAKRLNDKNDLQPYLPEEFRGQTIKGNQSYGRSIENSLVCIRSLLSGGFLDKVSEKLGRPLTIDEQLIACQVLANITGNMKECAYCYVKNDRAAYRAFFNKYWESYSDIYSKANKNKEAYSESIKMGKGDENTLYHEFLGDRKNTDQMWKRYCAFAKDGINGKKTISLNDLATANTRADARKVKGKGWFMTDAEKYCKSSARPTNLQREIKIKDENGKTVKIPVEYVSYNGSILSMKKELIDTLNSEYGLRMYSYSDYVPHNILENIQMVTDASVRGLKMLAYTKDIGFAKVFAPTNMGINISVFGSYNAKTGMVDADEMQGANWAEAQALREKYGNVGVVFVATNDEAVTWALKQGWIDVVIPFHTVTTGTEEAKYYGYKDYKSTQGDKKLKGWTKDNLSSIPPTIHANNKEQYLAALKANNLSPRFNDWKGNPNYMKLVNETRMAYTDMQPVQPTFNTEAVMAELDRIPKEGIYGGLQGNLDTEAQGELINEYADVATYANRIKNGEKNKETKKAWAIEDVPADIRENVRTAIKADELQRASHSREIDEKYFEAVKNKDMDTAQKMVDEVAKTNGYESINLYHGSHNIFTEFNPGRGIFLTNSKKMAKTYGDKLYPLYVKMDNPLVIYGDGANWDSIPFNTKEVKELMNAWTDYDEKLSDKYDELEKRYWEDGQIAIGEVYETNRIVEWAKNHNYDGVIFKDITDYGESDEVPFASDVYVAFNANQVKSSDSATYDDNGEVVPLSKRFDVSNNDIRKSREIDKKNTFTVYHGSPTTGITEFDIEKAGQNTNNPQDKAIWFTDDKKFADDFSYERKEHPKTSLLNIKGKKGTVYQADITMEKPFDLRNITDGMMQLMYKSQPFYDDYDRFKKAVNEYAKAGNHQAIKKYIDYEALKKAGYDGVIAKTDTKGNALEYGVFDKSQIQMASAKSREWTPGQTMKYKSEQYLNRAENRFTNSIVDALQASKFADRKFVKDTVKKVSDEFFRTGTISAKTRNELFDEAYEQARVNDEHWLQQNKRLKDTLDNSVFAISDFILKDIPDSNAWLKDAKKYLKFAPDGESIDKKYKDLMGTYPDMFPDATDESAEISNILDVVKSISTSERTLEQHYGEFSKEYMEWSRRGFDEALNRHIAEMNKVRRYNESAAPKAKQKITADDIKEAYSKVHSAKKTAEKAVAKNLLTAEDEIIVGRLLRGEETLENLSSSKYNVRGIKEVYEAKKAYEDINKIIKIYNAQRKEALREKAAELLESSNGWKDKGSGFAYARETMVRNLRDIIPDKKTAQAVIDYLYTPVVKAQAEKVRYKDVIRKKVASLDLSRKVANGNDCSESFAVQFIGEAEDNLRYLKEHPKEKTRAGLNAEEWQREIDALWHNNPNMDKAKIDNAIKTFRELYDQIREDINNVYLANGYEPVPYRYGYFMHFMQDESDSVLGKAAAALGIRTDVTDLPTEINGRTAMFRPGRTWFGSGLERKGNNTVYDAVLGIDKYLESAADVIYDTENIQRLRQFAQEARYKTSDEGLQKQIDEIRESNAYTEPEKDAKIAELYSDGKFALSNFVVELDEYTNQLANKKSKYDRSMEGLIGRKMYNIVKKIEGNNAANLVGVNPGSWLTNFIPLTQAFTTVDSKHMLMGMWDTLKGYKNNDGFADSSDYLTGRFGSDHLVPMWAEKLATSKIGAVRQKWQEGADKIGVGMDIIDGFVSESIVRARFYQNISSGMSEANAIKEADQFAANLQAARTKGSMPTIFGARNPVFKLFTQFQLEVNNEFSWLLKDIPDELAGQAVAKIAASLLKFLIGTYLFNDLYEFIVGRRPALDPLGMLNDTVGDLSGYKLPNALDFALGRDDFKTEKKSLWDSTTALAGNAVEELPFVGGVLGGGRVPISSGLPDVEKIAKTLMTDTESSYKKSVVTEELSKSALYLALPGGGAQANKMYKGAKSLIEGGSYKLTKDGTKNLQYPVWNESTADLVENIPKGLLFGKSSFKTARDWVESGFSSLNSKYTQMYDGLLNLGVSQKNAWKFVNEFKNIKATDNEKVKALQEDYIIKSDISDDAKSVVYDATQSNPTKSYTQWKDMGGDPYDYLKLKSSGYKLDNEALAKIQDRGVTADDIVKAYNKKPEITDVKSQGFKSIDELKKKLGGADTNEDWHHIVEQEQNFAAEKIQNSNNIVSIQGGTDSMHSLLTKYYRTEEVQAKLKNMSFEEQWQFGVDYLSQFGTLVPGENSWVFVTESNKKVEQALEDLEKAKYKEAAEDYVKNGFSEDKFYSTIESFDTKPSQKEVLQYFKDNKVSEKEQNWWWKYFSEKLDWKKTINDAKKANKMSSVEKPKYLSAPGKLNA